MLLVKNKVEVLQGGFFGPQPTRSGRVSWRYRKQNQVKRRRKKSMIESGKTPPFLIPSLTPKGARLLVPDQPGAYTLMDKAQTTTSNKYGHSPPPTITSTITTNHHYQRSAVEVAWKRRRARAAKRSTRTRRRSCRTRGTASPRRRPEGRQPSSCRRACG